MPFEKLSLLSGGHIAYHKTPGNSPGVVYCCGYRSDMQSTKALALESFCRSHQLAFVRFDYRGIGQSSDTFEMGTIGKWREDAINVLDHLTEGPQILIGSSMGGWIAPHVAMARPNKVHALITLAAAPDFVTELMAPSFTLDEKNALLKNGFFVAKSSYSDETYPVTRLFIEDAKAWEILSRELPIQCPVRLLHGMHDTCVPWEYSIRLSQQMTSQDVRICLIKDGEHRLMREADLSLLKQNISEFL